MKSDRRKSIFMFTGCITAIIILWLSVTSLDTYFEQQYRKKLGDFLQLCQSIDNESENIHSNEDAFSPYLFSNRHYKRILEDNYVDFIGCIDTIDHHIQNYTAGIREYDKTNRSIKREIERTEAKLNKGKNYERRSFLNCRRFDTDYNRNSRGIYECDDIKLMRKVAVSAFDDELVGYSTILWVQYLGEKDVIVNYSNAFRSWSQWEYYRHYLSVNEVHKPTLWMTTLDSLNNVYTKNTDGHQSFQDSTFQVLNSQSAEAIKKILEILESILAE